jgi:hypothetical protein
LGRTRSKTITKGYIVMFVLWQRLSTLTLSQVSLPKHSLLPEDVS